jgi:hypothetical protein
LKLGQGDTIILRKIPIQNGKKLSSKLELSTVEKASESVQPPTDNLREILLNCIHDADYVAKNSGLQFSLDEIQKLATTLFIARSKAY